MNGKYCFILLIPFVMSKILAQTFVVSGEVRKVTEIGPEIMSELPTKTYTVKGKTPVIYKGVSLYAILDKIGFIVDTSANGKPEPSPEFDFHKKALRNYVVIRASDDYQVVFSMGELDEILGENRPFIAFYRNDKLLKEGPTLLVPSDKKRKMRWIKEIEEIKVFCISK